MWTIVVDNPERENEELTLTTPRANINRPGMESDLNMSCVSYSKLTALSSGHLRFVVLLVIYQVIITTCNQI